MGFGIMEGGEPLAEISHRGREFFEGQLQIRPEGIPPDFRTLHHLEYRKKSRFGQKAQIAMPLIGDPSLARRQFKDSSLLQAGILEVGMRFRPAKMLPQRELLLVAESLIGKEENQMLCQQLLDFPAGGLIQFSQIHPGNLRPQSSREASDLE